MIYPGDYRVSPLLQYTTDPDATLTAPEWRHFVLGGRSERDDKALEREIANGTHDMKCRYCHQNITSMGCEEAGALARRLTLRSPLAGGRKALQPSSTMRRGEMACYGDGSSLTIAIEDEFGWKAEDA